MFTKLSFFFGGPRLLSDKINSACNYDLKKKKKNVKGNDSLFLLPDIFNSFLWLFSIFRLRENIDKTVT